MRPSSTPSTLKHLGRFRAQVFGTREPGEYSLALARSFRLLVDFLSVRLRANAPEGQKQFPISALKPRDLKQATQVTLRSGGCGKRQEEFLRRSVSQISASLTDSRAPV